MELKDVTANCQMEVSLIKVGSPKGTKVKIYDMGATRFIYSFSDSSQMLSISNLKENVSELDLKHGITKIMKLDLVDVLINVGDSGVVMITEKTESYPREANCYY